MDIKPSDWPCDYLRRRKEKGGLLDPGVRRGTKNVNDEDAERRRAWEARKGKSVGPSVWVPGRPDYWRPHQTENKS